MLAVGPRGAQVRRGSAKAISRPWIRKSDFLAASHAPEDPSNIQGSKGDDALGTLRNEVPAALRGLHTCNTIKASCKQQANVLKNSCVKHPQYSDVPLLRFHACMIRKSDSMAAAHANVNARITVDLDASTFKIHDAQWNDLIDGHTQWCEEDDTLYRALHCGRFRGLEGNVVEMWENLTHPNCASWKYFEHSIPLQGGRPRAKDLKGEDKWDDYHPIFNINKYGGKVYRDTIGMYARDLGMPLRIESPPCVATTKVVIDGHVCNVLAVVFRKSDSVNVVTQKRFSDADESCSF
jgi:hypothetical protein